MILILNTISIGIMLCYWTAREKLLEEKISVTFFSNLIPTRFLLSSGFSIFLCSKESDIFVPFPISDFSGFYMMCTTNQNVELPIKR